VPLSFPDTGAVFTLVLGVAAGLLPGARGLRSLRGRKGCAAGDGASRSQSGAAPDAETVLEPSESPGGTASAGVMDLARRLALQTNELEAARRATEQARQAMQATDELLADISHEIRTPLNAVLGAVGLLLETPLTREQRQLVETVRSSGKAQLALIRDMLEVARAAAGVTAATAGSVDLLALVRQTVALFAAQAERKGLRLDVRRSSRTVPLVNGDGTRIGRVVANLVSNAVKFTDGGRIEVHVGYRPAGAGCGRVRVEVKDTGIGIPEDELHLAFQRFTRLGASRGNACEGAGLGLAIAKRLVEGMGGAIGAVSRVGDGTTVWFTLELPLAEATAGSGTDGGAEGAPGGPRARRRSRSAR
jgi:signal transduction histidine kinase